MSTITASLYLRVSTATQTCENQRRELESYCQRQGWKIGHVYEDHGFSGTKTDRPALNQLLQDARDGKAGNVVVCWKIDRLARSTIDLLRFLVELKNAGMDFCATTQAIDTTTSYGKMVLTLLGAIAEFERDTIVERVRSGLDRAKANGTRLGRPRVGFDVNRAVQMKKDGGSWSQVAKALGVSSATLRRVVPSLLNNPAA